MHIIVIPDKHHDKYMVDEYREKHLIDLLMEIKDVNRVTIIRDFTDTMSLSSTPVESIAFKPE